MILLVTFCLFLVKTSETFPLDNQNLTTFKLTKGEINDLLEKSPITNKTLISRESHKKALMVVLPYTADNSDSTIEDLYTKAPVTKIVDNQKVFNVTKNLGQVYPQPFRINPTSEPLKKSFNRFFNRSSVGYSNQVKNQILLNKLQNKTVLGTIENKRFSSNLRNYTNFKPLTTFSNKLINNSLDKMNSNVIKHPNHRYPEEEVKFQKEEILKIVTSPDLSNKTQINNFKPTQLLLKEKENVNYPNLNNKFSSNYAIKNESKSSLDKIKNASLNQRFNNKISGVNPSSDEIINAKIKLTQENFSPFSVSDAIDNDFKPFKPNSNSFTLEKKYSVQDFNSQEINDFFERIKMNKKTTMNNGNKFAVENYDIPSDFKDIVKDIPLENVQPLITPTTENIRHLLTSFGVLPSSTVAPLDSSISDALAPEMQSLLKSYGLIQSEDIVPDSPEIIEPVVAEDFNRYKEFKPLPESSNVNTEMEDLLKNFGLISNSRSSKALDKNHVDSSSTKTFIFPETGFNFDAVPDLMHPILEEIGLKSKEKQSHVFSLDKWKIEEEEKKKLNDLFKTLHKLKDLNESSTLDNTNDLDLKNFKELTEIIKQETKSAFLGSGPNPEDFDSNSTKNDVKREDKIDEYDSFLNTESNSTDAPKEMDEKSETISKTRNLEDLEDTNLPIIDEFLNQTAGINLNESSVSLTEQKNAPTKTDQINLTELEQIIKETIANKTSKDNSENYTESILKTLSSEDLETLLKESTKVQEISVAINSDSTIVDNKEQDVQTSTNPQPEPSNLAALEESFGGPSTSSSVAIEESLPPPRRTGFYYLVDWNTFLEVGEEGRNKVNIRFSPKAGDPSRFLKVTVP